MSRESKLAGLRHKTNRELVILVQRELNRGAMVADVAMTKGSPAYAQTERAYQMVKACLPLISGLDRDERHDLELRLGELGAALDRQPSEKIKGHFACAMS
jgi:hypothetical protein